jgi:type IV pilus assembly protein PilB
MSDLGERVTKLKEPPTLYRGKGCKNCRQSGYRGRSGIYELLLVNEEIKKLISERASTQVIREVAGKTAGLVPLRADGLRKALKGTTTIEEVDRVAY